MKLLPTTWVLPKNLVTNDDLHYVPHEVVRAIRQLAMNASAPHSDGFTQCSYKHDLYVLKCYIEDVYKGLPEFPQQEREWEQARLMEILKRK
jgi:hypothetical protein